MRIGRSIKLATAGIAAVGAVAFSAGAASAASSLGGDAFTSNCHGYVAPYSSNLAYGHVDGPSSCRVNLWQANIQTGGVTQTGWGGGANTWSLYHGDGVHELQVEITDVNTGEVSYGSLVY